MIVLGVEMDAGAVHHNLIGLRASLDEALSQALEDARGKLATFTRIAGELAGKAF